MKQNRTIMKNRVLTTSLMIHLQQMFKQLHCEPFNTPEEYEEAKKIIYPQNDVATTATTPSVSQGESQ